MHTMTEGPGHMYSVKRLDNQEMDEDNGDDAVSPAKPHQDISPELKEVMHLLKMIEIGKDKKHP